MKKLALFVLLLVPVFGMAQILDWGKGLSGADAEFIYSISKKPGDHSFIGGYFSSELSVGNTALLTGPTSLNGFVSKIDTAGNPVWVTPFLGNSSSPGVQSFILKVEADGTGGAYAIGRVTDSMTVGSFSVGTALGMGANYLVKLDANGQPVFLKTFEAWISQLDVVRGLEVDKDGNALITGSFFSEIEIDGTTISGSMLPGNGFIAKFDPNGNLLWHKVFYSGTDGAIGGGYGGGTGWSISTDSSGTVYWAGAHSDSSHFEGDTIPYEAGYLIKLTANGQTVWRRELPPLSYYYLITVTPDQELVGVLGYDDTISLDGTTYTPTAQGSSANEELLVFQLDTSGAVNWSRPVKTPGHLFRAGVSVDELGGIHLFCRTHGLAAGSNIEFHDGTNYTLAPLTHYSFAFRMEDNGDLTWVKFLPSNAISLRDSKYTGNGQLQFVGTFWDTISLGGDTLDFSNVGHDGYYASMRVGGNEMRGDVFLDPNLNGVRDAGEQLESRFVGVQPSGSNHFSSTTKGYRAFLPPGSFTATVLNPPLYYEAVPATHSATFTNTGEIDSLNHFALQPIPANDLQVFVTPLGAARPGFPFRVNVTCRNIGTTTLDPTVEFNYDSQLDFDSAAPAQTTANGSLLTWNFTNLAPQAERSINVDFTVQTTTLLGDSIGLDATVLPIIGDTVPEDNSDSTFSESVQSFSQNTQPVIVVGSYDPNDKQVFPNGQITPEQVSSAEWLTYTVRFQNTGTDTAFTVVIRDTLDSNLNLISFEDITASDKYSVTFNGRAMAFHFDNILLPDSNTNEPESHGFIKYRIKPKNTLDLGDTIRNTAHIYFDFNTAIVTNTTVNWVDTLLPEPPDTTGTGIANINRERSGMLVYPNPGKGIFRIQAFGIPDGPVQLQVMDILGKEVGRWNFRSALELHTTRFQANTGSGLLILKLTHPDGEIVRKYVKK